MTGFDRLYAPEMRQDITPEDFRAGTPPRIMGKEFELRPSRDITADSLALEVSEQLAGPYVVSDKVRWHPSFSMHDEAGEHIEIRTPEALGPRELVIAGIVARNTFVNILRKSLATKAPVHPGGEAPATVHFHAGSYDHRPQHSGSNSDRLQRRGFHLSMITPEMSSEQRNDFLAITETYSVTASWAGAGMLGPEGFRLFQKDGLAKKYNVNGVSDGSRRSFVVIHAAVNAANDSVTKGWARAERRVGDAIRSTYAEFADAAAMSLMARIVEHWDIFSLAEQLELGGVMVANPAKSLSVVAKDLSLRKTLLCRDGRRRTAMDIQGILLQYTRKVAQKFDLPADEEAGLDMWQNLVDITARTKPLDGEVAEAACLIHWAARLGYLMLKYDVPVEKLSGTDPQQNSHSLGMDLLYPVDPMARFAERTSRGIIIPAEVHDRVLDGPRGVRSEARNSLLRRHADPDDPLTVEGITWNSVRVMCLDTRNKPRRWEIILKPYNSAVPDMQSWGGFNGNAW